MATRRTTKRNPSTRPLSSDQVRSIVREELQNPKHYTAEGGTKQYTSYSSKAGRRQFMLDGRKISESQASTWLSGHNFNRVGVARLLDRAESEGSIRVGSNTLRIQNPSLVGDTVGMFFPVDHMRRIGQGAVDDFKRLASNRRRNAGETAENVFEGFHGTPSTRTEIVEDEILIEDNLAECGPLQSIRVKVVTGFTTTIKFDKDRQPMLCSSPDRNQLYVIGGDQELDLYGLGFEKPSEIKHLMKIGVAKQVTYFAKKGFDNFEPTDYFHDLGEENGVRPDLMYDTLNKTLLLVGGDYRVLDEGITN